MPFYGTGSDELHLAFNFLFVHAKLDAAEMRAIVEGVEAKLPHGAWPVYTGSNHDASRLATRWAGGDERAARAALVMLLTLRGTPFLYYGEEIGMVTTEPKTVEEVRDPVGQRYWPLRKGRDGERTPMQWDAGPHAGFTTGAPWLPVPPSARERNVAAQAKDPGSLLNFYKRLIALRRRSAALLDGNYTPLGDDPHVYAYRRRARGQTAIVALNMSGERRAFALPEPERGAASVYSVALSSRPAPVRGRVVSGELSLAPFEAVILTASTR
jgi:alpha-glucosidase